MIQIIQLKTKNFWILFSIGIIAKDFKDKNGDNKGIRLIKKFVFNIYKLIKETSSEKEKDA